MFHVPGEDIGDGLDAPVGVPWKALKVVFGGVRAKIIQQQEGIEHGNLTEPQGPVKMHPGPLRHGFAFENLLDLSGFGHDRYLFI
jgi:hypothetical protein